MFLFIILSEDLWDQDSGNTMDVIFFPLHYLYSELYMIYNFLFFFPSIFCGKWYKQPGSGTISPIGAAVSCLLLISMSIAFVSMNRIIYHTLDSKASLHVVMTIQATLQLHILLCPVGNGTAHNKVFGLEVKVCDGKSHKWITGECDDVVKSCNDKHVILGVERMLWDVR